MISDMHIFKKALPHIETGWSRYASAALIGLVGCWSATLLIDRLGSVVPSLADVIPWTCHYSFKFVYAGLFSAVLLLVWDRWPKPLSAMRFIGLLCFCAFVALLLFLLVLVAELLLMFLWIK